MSDLSVDQVELKVRAGNSFSEGFNLLKRSIVAVLIPVGWDGGDITIESSFASPTDDWKVVTDSDGTAIGLSTVVADTVITMAGNELQALMQLKRIRFRGASTVAADKTLTLLLKEE